MTDETREESEAYVRGREAGMAGALDSENPYRIGTDESMDWEDGRASQDTGA